MPKSDRTVPMLSETQEASLLAAIARNPDSREPSDAMLAQMKPASQALTVGLYASLTKPRGRPKSAVTKVPVKLRLDAVAVETFKQTGPGWQTRMNDIIVAAAAALEIGTPVKTKRPPLRETPAK
jgi:uncharacterized protein (DUF4415 family)